MKKDDFYIDLLRTIQKTPLTWNEIKEKYPDEEEFIWINVRDSNILYQGKDTKYRLSFNSRFKLLEHDELIEARQTAREARIIAFCSILITAIIGILQII